MQAPKSSRILVVSDTASPGPVLLGALERRAEVSPCQFRFLVLNPARAELHLLHPERHDKAAQAEDALRRGLPAIERAAGSRVIGSVSVFHDAMDAIEHTLDHEPFDEMMLALPAHPWASRLHLDLPHRLGHLGLQMEILCIPRTRTRGETKAGFGRAGAGATP